MIRCQLYHSISDDNCSQKAAANEKSVGCHRVSLIFQGDRTRSSKLLNANQITSLCIGVLHESAVFNLQPEDHSRYYPGR